MQGASRPEATQGRNSTMDQPRTPSPPKTRETVEPPAAAAERAQATTVTLTGEYLFDQPLRMLILAVLLPVIFLLGPRIIWVLSDPKLPSFYVRPSSGSALERLGLTSSQQPQCRNLYASAEDPWHRTGSQDPTMQELRYCEDAKLVENHQTALIACDPGRAKWNTVMGLLVEAEPRGALWMYDYSTGKAEPQLVDVRGFPDDRHFHPLGMHVQHTAEKERMRLFVINHGKAANHIEEFELRASNGPKPWVAECGYRRDGRRNGDQASHIHPIRQTSAASRLRSRHTRLTRSRCWTTTRCSSRKITSSLPVHQR